MENSKYEKFEKNNLNQKNVFLFQSPITVYIQTILYRIF